MNQRYLCFGLGGEEFAVPLLAVREVIAMPKTTTMPFMPAHFLGLMNLRGTVVSVIDLRQKMRIQPRRDSENAVVILQDSGMLVGTVVDSVNSVLNVTEKDFSVNPASGGEGDRSCVSGVCRKGDRLILLLDVLMLLREQGGDMSVISRTGS